jgi:transcriptional regulator with XRE-family HTH domain
MRVQADRSLGDLARHLGLSIVYLSDIERDRRGALGPIKILEASEFLETSPDLLLRAAAESKGTFDLDVRDYSPVAFELLSGLAKGRHRDEVYQRMLDILNEDEKPNESNA